MPVKHAFTSAKSDGGDATLIRPSNWNADHSGTNDHDHSATGVGGVLPYATPAIALGTAAAAGSATTPIRSNSTIVAFDTTVPVVAGTAATGSAAVAARRDHVHPLQSIAPGVAAIVAGAGIANTETVVVSYTAPANSMVAGTTFRVTAGGTQTSGATGGTAVFRVRIGTTTLTGNIATTVSPVNANSQTGVGFWFEALVTVYTAGGSGTVIGQCIASGQVAFTAPINMVGVVTATVAVDTAAQKLVELTYISGNAGTTATFRVASIEIVK